MLGRARSRACASETGRPCGADAVVVAAGRWSAQLDGVPAGAAPPVRPVKGQILRLLPVRARAGADHDGAGHGAGLLGLPRPPPRRHRRAWAPPSRRRGFDTAVTAGAVYELLRDAHRVVPGVTEMILGEVTTGLRPGSPDNAPIVGRAPVAGVDGLVMATGHYRQGILLAPVDGARPWRPSSRAGEPPEEMAPFGPGRFAGVGGARRHLIEVPCWVRG